MQSREQLLSILQDRCEEMARHGFATQETDDFAGADPWLLSSLLQKAIRRSDLIVSRRAGFQLLVQDPSRLWRRLMVIALEDIGIGDLQAAVLLITLATMPEGRRLLGGNVKALEAGLRIACEATKDRTGDAMGSIAREMGTEPGHSLEAASEATRLAVLGYGHLPWRRRLRAACLLGEEDLPAAERISRYQPLADLFRAIGVPDSLVSACSVYRGRSRDLLPIFVPLAFSLWQAAGGPRRTLTHELASPLIGEMPDYALDPLHTRLGRRAVELWLKSHPQKPRFEGRQIAMALWNKESGACFRTLDWPLGREIEQEGWGADLLRSGLRPDRYREILSWLEAEKHVLACARRTVWQSVHQTRPSQSAPSSPQPREHEPC